MGLLSRVLAAATVAFVFIGNTAVADTLNNIKDRGTLTVGVKSDYDPFGYLDENGKLVGLEVELGKFLAKELLGSEDALELVPVTAANRIEFLQSGRIDLILATLGVTDARRKVIDFTEAYVMAPGASVMSRKQATFTDWEQIRGQKACGIQGAYFNKHLTETYEIELINFTSVPEAARALIDNRCVGMAYDDMTLRRMVRTEEWQDYKIAIDPYEYLPMAGGLRKDDDAFKAAVNAAIHKAEAGNKFIEWEKQFNIPPAKYSVERAEAARAAAE